MVRVGFVYKVYMQQLSSTIGLMLARSFSASDTAMQNALQVSNAGE